MADVVSLLEPLATAEVSNRKLYSLKCSVVGRPMYIMKDWHPNNHENLHEYARTLTLYLCVSRLYKLEARMICLKSKRIVRLCSHAICENVTLW